jgi:hypothetical protein
MADWNPRTMKIINPPLPPFSLRPRRRPRGAHAPEGAVSLRAGGLYEPEADPEGKGGEGGFGNLFFKLIKGNYFSFPVY